MARHTRRNTAAVILLLALVGVIARLLLYIVPRAIVRPLWLWLFPTTKVVIHRVYR